MKRFANPVSKVNAEVIGLDVHQAVIVGCRLDRRGNKVGEPRFGGGRQELLKFLDEEVGRRRPHFALEACGGFLWIYDLLAKRYGKERVHVAQPRRIQMIADSTSKNDRNDAFGLAYLTFEGRLPEAHVPRADLPRDAHRLARAHRRRAVAIRRGAPASLAPATDGRAAAHPIVRHPGGPRVRGGEGRHDPGLPGAGAEGALGRDRRLSGSGDSLGGGARAARRGCPTRPRFAARSPAWARCSPPRSWARPETFGGSPLPRRWGASPA